MLALAALIGASAEGCKINPGKSADGNGPTTAAAPAPTQPQQNQPTHPIPTADNGAPPKIPDYSSGGTECTFYSEGNATSIELSADGNTLIGTVLITCVPLPKELRIFIKMYALPAGSTVWRQLGQDQVWTWPTPPELPPETFPPLNPIHIERPCAAGRYFITYKDRKSVV